MILEKKIKYTITCHEQNKLIYVSNIHHFVKFIFEQKWIYLGLEWNSKFYYNVI